MPVRQTPMEWALHWEKNAPDRLWFTQPMGGGKIKTWTWGEAMRDARKVAAFLKGLDLAPRSHIALCSKNCAHWIITDLGIALAGHISIPLYPTLTAETTRAILEHSESKLLFVGKLDMWDTMKAGVPDGVPMVDFPLSPRPNDYQRWEDVIDPCKPLEEVESRTGEELGTIVYTSGSTGMPKGVMLSYGAMNASAEAVVGELGLNPKDRILSYLPLAHVMERFLVLCGGLVAGNQIFFAESLDTFVQDLQRARPTLFISVPRLWLKFQLGVFKKMPPAKLARMLKIPILKSIVKKKIKKALGLQDVRLAGSGSAPISAELIQWYRQLGIELLEGYGMTENFAYSHLSRPGNAKPGYVGQPYNDVKCRISEEGEVQILSPGNMMGYYKAEDLTKESFTEDGWLRTGDRGEIDKEGRLKITGRTKELFKTSKGKYVSPAPIENKINNHHRVEASCVGGSGQPAPHCLVLLDEDTRASLKKNGGDRAAVETELQQLLAEVNGGLDHHEQMQFIAVVNDEWAVDNGFLTPTMKIKRNVVEKTYAPFIEDWYATKQPVVWQG